jgi:hypothetical protein
MPWAEGVVTVRSDALAAIHKWTLFQGRLKKSLGRISGRLRFLAQIIGLRPRQREGVGSISGIAVSANRIKNTNQVFFSCCIIFFY